MPRYEKGTLGKLVVQDWDIVSGYPDTPRLYILTEQQASALVALASFLQWRTRWQNAPGDDTLDAFASETMFNLMNPITCAMLQECLQPLFDTLRTQVNQDAIFREFGSEYPVAEPLPEEVADSPLAPGTNPTCNLDILWAQSEQTVLFSDFWVTDALQKLEGATNNAEAIAVLSQLPIIDEFGFDAIAGYAELLLDGIAENYEAAYTLAYQQEVACEIFCAAQENCEITLNLIFDVFRERVEAYYGTPIGAITSVMNIISYLLDQSIDGTIVADAMMLIIWGSARYGNTFLGTIGTAQLEATLQLAVNDANDDWSILCDCGWFSLMDVTTSMFTWEAYPSGKNWGTFVNASGIESGFDTTEGAAYQMVQIRLPFAAPAKIARIAFDFDMANGTQNPGTPFAVGTDNLFVDSGTPAPDGTGQTFDREIRDDNASEIALRCQAGFLNPGSTNPGGSCKVTQVRVWGLGTKPPELP